ncbi:TonB-dependent receptor [Gaoshiqia sp. Z1-71]|uniref:TonB-dependent receptor n=1 Tax=Gaoshiqia hydrogeniformans TaxID=3290090 RepID=UPI003BF89226
MNKLILIFLLFPLISAGQAKIRLSGYVQDAASGERLVGATVFHASSQTGTATNAFGYFNLLIHPGEQSLLVQYVGYKKRELSVSLRNDSTIIILLEAGLDLDEIQVKVSGRQTHGELSRLNYSRLDMDLIERLPVILGETDVLKAIQYLPGVKGARENTASYNVRGGSSDQNLILLDGAPVYNVNHAFGFFSTFNNHAIKNASFYKGGIPARYGGRLASVLDITSKEGNMKKGAGVFSISPISAQATYEGPIKQDTASFLLSCRRTFFDLPMILSQKIAGEDQEYGYQFYDLNAKANWIINENNRVYWSVYAGRDKQFYESSDRTTHNEDYYQWGNLTSVLRWNSLLSNKLFANFSLYYSRYNYEVSSFYEDDDVDKDFYYYTHFKTTSKLWDYSLKADLEYNPKSNYTMRFGSQVSYLEFAPNVVQQRGTDDNFTFNDEYRNQSLMSEVYLENDYRHNRLSVNAGLRLSGYLADGAFYIYPQPRLAVAYELNSNWKASGSYMYMSQYLHKLSNSSMGMPADLWVASTGRVKPETGQQVSLGIEKSFNDTYRGGMEVYGKNMNNVIRYVEGESFLDTKNTNWEDILLIGQGRAYGSEFFLEKMTGRLTGMLSYTLSKTERQFDDLNAAEWFPDNYDRRHDLSLFGEYKLYSKKPDKKKSLTFGFTCQSGNKLSIPDTEQPGFLLPGMDLFLGSGMPWFLTRKTYDHPNNFKMPAFHHLDLGYSSTKKKANGHSRTWNFSVYNVYNRLNPWYYYKKKGEVRKVSIFPVVPSVTYTYSW